MAELSDDELLAELGVAVEVKPVRAHTPLQERIIAGFEDIVKFHTEHGRPPQHGEERDIFERLYAVRLDRLRDLPEARELLAPMDTAGLLDAATSFAVDVAELNDDALLAELGIEVEPSPDDITQLRHVPSREERRAAEEIANREACPDFEKFKSLFITVKDELDKGLRETREFQRTAEIKQGEFFIVGGQIAYVAELGEEFITEYDRKDRRTRVIYDNGTESNMLARSLQKALYRDGAGRRITNPSAGPLFGTEADGDDSESGIIYVLRSKSDHPEITANRNLLHKIGVTGGTVVSRVANAAKDATYLLADVEVIAEYKLFNINRAKLEKLIHRFFGSAQFAITINDRFGNPVRPREWFLVPLAVIDQAVEKIVDGSLKDYEYDPETASIRLISE
jgi:hypothetical protein